MDLLSSVFGEPVNVWISSVFAYRTCGFLSFCRSCERMGFVSSVFGVPVRNVCADFREKRMGFWQYL